MVHYGTLYLRSIDSCYECLLFQNISRTSNNADKSYFKTVWDNSGPKTSEKKTNSTVTNTKSS